MKKKLISISLVSLFLLNSCYVDMEYNSLEDYIELISKDDCGYTSTGLDRPSYFLPSRDFFAKFSYEYGEYYLYEEDVMRIKHRLPVVAFLYLKYTADIYYCAKEFMISKIPAYNNKFYYYDNYHFFVNQNFMDSFIGVQTPIIPKCFTMACYNDNKNTLLFIGFYDCVNIDNKYYSNFEENFKSFIDIYFGACYDFSI